MSDVQPGPTWWQASDGKWYAPELHPAVRPVVPVVPARHTRPSPFTTRPAATQRLLRPHSGALRGWIIGGAILAVLIIAGLAVALIHRPPPASATASSAPTANSSTESLSAQADKFQSASNALATQMTPYAKTVSTSLTDAASAITSGQAQITQIEQSADAAATQNISGTSPQAVAAQQCIRSAANAPLGTPESQIVSAIDACNAPRWRALPHPSSRWPK